MRFFSRGQVSLELIITVGFILLIFIIVVILALEKNILANNLKLSMDAQSVLDSIAFNINTISQQSYGYYRYVSVPYYLFGSVDYNVSSSKNFLSIHFDGSEWVTQVLAANVTIYCLDKGETLQNRIENTGDAVIVTCHKPNLFFVRESFSSSSNVSGTNTTISVRVRDKSHVRASAFIVRLNGSLDDVVPSLEAEAETTVFFNVTVPSVGTHILPFEIDPIEQLDEGIESDNFLNVSWVIGA